MPPVRRSPKIFGSMDRYEASPAGAHRSTGRVRQRRDYSCISHGGQPWAVFRVVKPRSNCLLSPFDCQRCAVSVYNADSEPAVSTRSRWTPHRGYYKRAAGRLSPTEWGVACPPRRWSSTSSTRSSWPTPRSMTPAVGCSRRPPGTAAAKTTLSTASAGFLLRGHERLTGHAWQRLLAGLDAGDDNPQVGKSWIGKEELRRVYASA